MTKIKHYKYIGKMKFHGVSQKTIDQLTRMSTYLGSKRIYFETLNIFIEDYLEMKRLQFYTTDIIHEKYCQSHDAFNQSHSLQSISKIAMILGKYNLLFTYAKSDPASKHQQFINMPQELIQQIPTNISSRCYTLNVNIFGKTF